MTDTVRVAVVEDHDSMRTALVRLLESSGLEASAFNCADDFLHHPECTKFDCVVIDLHLPRKDGLQLQKELKQLAPFAAQIFISGHADLKVGMHAIRQGAVDFLEKPIDDQALLEAIRRGADGSRKHRAALTERITLEARCESLTPREREVFALITKGLLNKQAGFELGTTERTIKAHRARVMEKMGAASLADLVRMASTLKIHSNGE